MPYICNLNYDRRESRHVPTLFSPWLRGGEGCFLCGKPRGTKDKHSHQDVNTDGANFKGKHSSKLLNVSDLAYITDLCTEIGEESADGEAFLAKLVQDDSKYESEQESDISFVAIYDIKRIEEELSIALLRVCIDGR